MKIKKNSVVKFVVNGYDRWGIVPVSKEFSFAFYRSHFLNSEDARSFEMFNKAFSKGIISKIVIAGEEVKDIESGYKLAYDEAKKYENCRFDKEYRVGRMLWGSINLLKYDTFTPRYLSSKFIDWLAEFAIDHLTYDECKADHHNYQTAVFVDDLFLYENDVATGEFYASDDAAQKKFRKMCRDYLLAKRNETK